jgi:carbon monoxide dehydrogenase subunit G
VKVEVSRCCSASPEAVWEWVADPHRHIQMLPASIRNAQVLEGGDMQAELFTAGVSELMVVRVTAAEPPRRLEEERVDGRRKATTVFELEPDGEGSRVTIRSEVEIPRLMAGLAKPAITRALDEQLANLDRLSSGAE